MTKVTLIDFGAGNILSMGRALRHVGADVSLADKPAAIESAERLVLPGVGAFAACIDALNIVGLDDAIRRFTATGRPFLGICVGLQMMFDASEEFGLTPGLGLLSGRICAIPHRTEDNRLRKIPHIGWNKLEPSSQTVGWKNTILAGLKRNASVYFVHSFAAKLNDPSDLLAVSDYDGFPVTAAVTRDNLFGCQFHPEKSGDVGLAILRNFLRA